VGSWYRKDKIDVCIGLISSPFYYSIDLPSARSLVVKRVLELQESTGGANGLAYFFCNRSEPDRRDPDGVMRTLVKQLCSQSAATLAPVAREYERREQAGFPSDTLDFRRCQELLIELLLMLPHTIIVIDALDECDQETRQQLLRVLQEICNACPGRVNIFVSSRNDSDILLELEGVPNHYIKPTDNAEDIEKFINVRLDTAIQNRKLLRGKVSTELKELIVKELSSGARGM